MSCEPFKLFGGGAGTKEALRTRRNQSHQITIFPVDARRAGETPNEGFDHG